MDTDSKEVKKINRLIIVGNGFDLSLGMNTNYKDFLYHYIKDIWFNVYFEVEKTGHRSIHLEKNTYRYVNDLIQLDCKIGETTKIIKDRLEKLDTYEKLTTYLFEDKILEFKFDLLNNIHDQLDMCNWIDIEVSYYDELVSLVKKTNSNHNREMWVSEYNSKFEKLKSELIKYLSKEKPCWVENNCKDRDNDDVLFYYNNFFEEQILSSKNNGYQVDKMIFLNFNYTSSLKDLLYFFKRREDIIHIHGTVNNLESVIFGFDDERDDNFSLFDGLRGNQVYKFIKTRHYNKNNNYSKLREFLNDRDYEVYILGHSCGVSDRTLMSYILESNQCKTIRMFYHEFEDSSTDIEEKSFNIRKYFRESMTLLNKIQSTNKSDLMYQLR